MEDERTTKKRIITPRQESDGRPGMLNYHNCVVLNVLLLLVALLLAILYLIKRDSALNVDLKGI